MPRGRPKGSKNKSTKAVFDIESSSNDLVWGIKEVSGNGIIWHHPLSGPPFLSKETAEKLLQERIKFEGLKSVSVVNMLERAKTFHKNSVAPPVESVIVAPSIEDGGSDGTEAEDTVASV